MAASSCFSLGVIMVAWLMRFILKRENGRIRAQESEAVNFYAY